MINFLTEKEPKMKLFDFGAFQKIRKILSREKYIFHILFGASHGTPRSENSFLCLLKGPKTSFISDDSSKKRS